MYRVKIFGAGSIGNHLTHAARFLGWEAVVCDVNDLALERMKKEIYPQRYGQWDDTIQLFNNRDAPVGGFDLIFIGTPPDSHLLLALEALHETPRAILIEKPLCKPSLDLANDFYQAVLRSSAQVFVGYDHVVGKATRMAEEMIKSGIIGNIQTLDVEFREHWAGIFKAHAWLKGPDDTYLGFWQLGGGASGEHSHAANLWQHFAHTIGAGRVVEVEAMLNYVTEGRGIYDNYVAMNLRTENGLVGRVVQDVISLPSRKRAKIQGTHGAIEWINSYSPEGDAIKLLHHDQPEEVHVLPKKRPEDFIEELRHIEAYITGKTSKASTISLERGLDTMLVVAAAHRSEREKIRVAIEYKCGYSIDALSPCRGEKDQS